MKENSIEEDIIKEFEKFCEDLYVFKDDDIGGHFEGIIGDQIANTMLGYLIFKEKLEEKISDYKRALKENEELKNAVNVVNKEKADWIRTYQEEKDKQFELLRSSIQVKEVKDKQINLMANHIASNDSNLCQYLDMTTKCKYYAGENGKTCDDCIKQYFENKAKE